MKLVFSIVFLININVCFSQQLFEPNIINTDKDEYGITFISEIWICFTRSGMRKSLYFSFKIKNKWSNPVLAPFSGEYDDEYSSYNTKTRRLYFSSKRPIKERSNKDSTERLYTNDIWYVELLEGNDWSNPIHLGGDFSTTGIDSGGHESLDYIYFHSDRRGRGFKSVDIYKLKMNDQNFKLKYLEMNAEGSADGEPYVFSDGKHMMFMSTRPGSKGKSDIFLSEYNEGNWQTPVSIDINGLVNTEGWEYTPSLSLDKKTLYFTRIVNGQSDIYFISTDELPLLNKILNEN